MQVKDYNCIDLSMEEFSGLKLFNYLKLVTTSSELIVLMFDLFNYFKIMRTYRSFTTVL